MPTLRDIYRQGLAALLADADRLGCTPDDLAARALVLAEVRHAIAAGLRDVEAREEPKPSKWRLVWVRDGEWDCIVPHGHMDGTAAVCAVCESRAKHYPGGICTADRQCVFADRVTALRAAAEWARADGYEVPDHPDAA